MCFFPLVAPINKQKKILIKNQNEYVMFSVNFSIEHRSKFDISI